MVSKLSQIWFGLFIPDPDPEFLPILDPGSSGQKGTGFRILIRNTGIKNGKPDSHERVPGDLGPALLQHGHVELVGLVHLAHRLLVLTSQPVTEKINTLEF